MRLIKPYFEIIPQQDLFKHIELCGRICYKSENKITEDSAEKFVNNLMKSGHTSVLEHGTIYLSASIDHSLKNKEEWLMFQELNVKYQNNPYSRSYIRQMNKEYSVWFAVTNYRVLVENGWLDDLKYQCEPTEYHYKRRITVRFVCDRGISHEIVRSRVFSFSQESTRYCGYIKGKFGNEITFIIPSWFKNHNSLLEQWNGYKLDDFQTIEENVKPKLFEEPYDVEDMYERVWILNCIQTEENYKFLMRDSNIEGDVGPWKPEQARSVLPNSLKTELVMTGFIDDWKHFFKLRTASNAHPQIRELAIPLEEEFKKMNLM